MRDEEKNQNWFSLSLYVFEVWYAVSVHIYLRRQIRLCRTNYKYETDSIVEVSLNDIYSTLVVDRFQLNFTFLTTD